MHERRATLYGWRQPRTTVAVLLLAASVCVGALVAYGLATPGGQGPPGVGAAALALLVLAAWVGFGVGVTCDLALDGDVLRWRTLFRGGEVPVEAVQRVRASRLGPAVVVIEHRQGQLRSLSALRGLRPLADDLARRNPAVEVDLPELGDVVDEGGAR